MINVEMSEGDETKKMYEALSAKNEKQMNLLGLGLTMVGEFIIDLSMI